MTGVYKITNTKTGLYYIGSSIDVEKRWKSHLHDLRYNCHNNKYLQNSFNKHGEKCFEFSVIEECTKETVREREDYWINELHATDHSKGFNILPTSNVGMGVSMSDETKRKISLACSMDKNGNFGRKHTPEELKLMHDNRWGENYIKKPRKKYNYGSKAKYTKEERSQMAKDRMTVEVREKIARKRTGMKASDELRQKYSRMRSGDKNSNCKLSKEVILQIYDDMASGVNYKIVCSKYNICQSTAYKIKRKEYWCFND